MGDSCLNRLRQENKRLLESSIINILIVFLPGITVQWALEIDVSSVLYSSGAVMLISCEEKARTFSQRHHTHNHNPKTYRLILKRKHVYLHSQPKSTPIFLQFKYSWKRTNTLPKQTPTCLVTSPRCQTDRPTQSRGKQGKQRWWDPSRAERRSGWDPGRSRRRGVFVWEELALY